MKTPRLPAAFPMAWGLLAIHTALLWLGFDRLPLLPMVGDGPLIQDPSLALARGQGLLAPSFAGTLGFERLYAHHPPLYIYLQALAFRVLGLTPLSMRVVALVSTTLQLLTVLVCLRKLRRLGALSASAVTPLAVLLLLEPATWYEGRWERMDSLVGLLGVLAFWLLLCAIEAGPQDVRRRRRWALAGAVASGAALATHLEAVIAYLFLASLAWSFRRRLGPSLLVGVVVLPGVVFGSAWLLAHGDRSLLAWLQLQRIASHHSGGALRVLLSPGASAWSIRSLLVWAPVVQATALLALVVSATTPSGSAADPASLTGPLRDALRNALIAALAFLLFVAGRNPAHVISLFPFALFTLGVHLHGARARTRLAVGVLTVALSVVSAAIVGGYLYTALSQWAERDPHRWDGLAAEIPPAARVAASPQFWYALQARNHPLRVIDLGFPADRAFWEAHPERLLDFDYVLASPGSGIAALMEAHGLTWAWHGAAREGCVVYTRSSERR